MIAKKDHCLVTINSLPKTNAIIVTERLNQMTDKKLIDAFKKAGFNGERSTIKMNRKVHRDVVNFLKKKDMAEKKSLKSKMLFD